MSKIMSLVLGIFIISKTVTTEGLVPESGTGPISRLISTLNHTFNRRKFYRSAELGAKQFEVSQSDDKIILTLDEIKIVLPKSISDRLAGTALVGTRISVNPDEEVELWVNDVRLPDAVAKKIKFDLQSGVLGGDYIVVDPPIIDAHNLAKLNKAKIYSDHAPGKPLPIQVLENGQKLEILVKTLKVVVKAAFAIRVLQSWDLSSSTVQKPLADEVQCNDTGLGIPLRLKNIEREISFSLKGTLSSHISLDLPKPRLTINLQYALSRRSRLSNKLRNTWIDSDPIEINLGTFGSNYSSVVDLWSMTRNKNDSLNKNSNAILGADLYPATLDRLLSEAPVTEIDLRITSREKSGLGTEIYGRQYENISVTRVTGQTLDFTVNGFIFVTPENRLGYGDYAFIRRFGFSETRRVPENFFEGDYWNFEVPNSFS